MNQGRIWTVVKPSVGLPLLLGSVTVIALGVHYAVLTHTTWFGAYWQGKATTKADLKSDIAPLAMNGYTVSINR
jgi:light-harvesting protein B-800-850 alpha chain